MKDIRITLLNQHVDNETNAQIRNDSPQIYQRHFYEIASFFVFSS